MNTQGQGMPPGQGGMPMNMGGMVIDNQMGRGQNFGGGQDFNFQNELAQKQKLMMQGRPSTNKLGEMSQAQNNMQQMALNRQMMGMIQANNGISGSQVNIMPNQFAQFQMNNNQMSGNRSAAPGGIGRTMGSKTQFRKP